MRNPVCFVRMAATFAQLERTHLYRKLKQLGIKTK
jgi:DNA-binding NtrC family response regulator